MIIPIHITSHHTTSRHDPVPSDCERKTVSLLPSSPAQPAKPLHFAPKATDLTPRAYSTYARHTASSVCRWHRCPVITCVLWLLSLSSSSSSSNRVFSYVGPLSRLVSLQCCDGVVSPQQWLRVAWRAAGTDTNTDIVRRRCGSLAGCRHIRPGPTRCRELDWDYWWVLQTWGGARSQTRNFETE